MPVQEYRAVSENDVPKVEGAVAVGEDLAFQRRWWRFETIIWTLFVLVLIADLAGLLGRGPLANVKQDAPDGSLQMKYERILRENTASIVTLLPGENAMQDGKLELYVSDSVVKQLGAQRIIPEPEHSVVGHGGVTYTFAASGGAATVQIELKPSFIGSHTFHVGVVGHPFLTAKSFVLP